MNHISVQMAPSLVTPHVLGGGGDIPDNGWLAVVLREGETLCACHAPLDVESPLAVTTLRLAPDVDGKSSLTDVILEPGPVTLVCLQCGQQMRARLKSYQTMYSYSITPN